MTDHRSAANRRGILAISLCMASFVSNDALVKYVSQSLPAAQLIFIRGAFASALLLVVAQSMGLLRGARGSETTARQHILQRPVVLRSSLDALGTMTFLGGLFHIPIGNATAINMAAPLFITLLAVLFMHERVSRARWLATAMGFVGVLLVVQPAADGFNAWALLCLLSALISSSRDLVTRVINPNVPAVLISLAAALTMTVLAGAWCALHGWQPVTVPQLGLLAAAGMFLSSGYYFAVTAMREGDISVVAPFRYTALVFALLIGWVVWGDVPNALAWAGIALLVGAGIYMVRGGGRN